MTRPSVTISMGLANDIYAAFCRLVDEAAGRYNLAEMNGDRDAMRVADKERFTFSHNKERIYNAIDAAYTYGSWHRRAMNESDINIDSHAAANY